MTISPRRKFLIGAAVLLALAGSAGGAMRVLAVRKLRAELDRAGREMKGGLMSLAYSRLAGLEQRWPGQPEVEYQLGLCELARGRRGEALAAWGRVPRRSAFAVLAAGQRATQLINSGRYTPAEAVIEEALGDAPATDPDLDGLRRVYNRLLRFEGRVDDVRRLLRATWCRSPDPASVLKELWLLDNSPFPVEAWQRSLENADPEDDRVWLGRASQATLTGRFAEAARLLDACQRRRPEDPAVWRARLALAEETGDVPRAWEAMTHLPASILSDRQVDSLRAWLADRRGDRAAERRAWRRLAESDPGNARAFERLALIASEAGEAPEARALREHKAEIDRSKDRFRKLLLGPDRLEDQAEELARLSRLLGRPFDARAWSLLARRTTGTALNDPNINAGAIGGTLADRLADLNPRPSRTGPSGPGGARPIEARATTPVFSDDAEAAGLRFIFDNGETPFRQLPETMSGGVAVLDYDGDGRLDVYAVQGGPLSPAVADKPGTGDRLFRNLGGNTFEDVTGRSGLAAIARGYGQGVAIGDVNNDGRPDIFVTRVKSYALYLNLGTGGFEDATAKVGLAGVRDTPTSAAFADLDGDGDLDLYVCHYMLYDPEHPRLCRNEKGGYFYCDPSRVDPAADHLFRNDEGRFTDVSSESGIIDPGGRGLGVVAADLDDDGKVDLYVANDGTASYLFHNLGGLRFEEVGHVSGVAAGGDGGYQAGMGVACGDFDGDGRPDLLKTNFYGESSTLYHNMGGCLFSDVTVGSGLGLATRYLLGFGTSFLDYDNDGHADLLTANGHVNDNRPFYPYAMPAQLLAGGPGGRFTDVSARAGPPLTVPRVGRGLAVADLDNDGKVDALILSQNEPLAYLHNQTPGGHQATFGLAGTKSNRDAVGARVAIVAGGRSQTAWRTGGGSYQSSSDPRIHFGLGGARVIDEVEIRWPSGRVDRHAHLPADAGYLLREGAPAAVPLEGFARP